MAHAPSTPDPAKIAGRYDVVQKLGAGAFGTVYKAKDQVLGRMLAIKTIRLDGIAAAGVSLDELVERFHREARISAQLKHPHIVTIYDVGSADGMSYLAMEFIDGVGLDKVISGAGRLSVERAATLGVQIAEALDFAHRQGVVHRDIKPANIMIESGDRAKVTDFGIARVMDSADHLTATGSLLGTPSYMSPEQARGSALDGRSDLFAVGCIVHEMLSGKKAFRADSITGLIFKIITEPAAPLAEAAPDVPAELVAVVEKALAKNPADRFQTGKEMAEALLPFTRAGAVPTVRQVELMTAPPQAPPPMPPLGGTLNSAPTAMGSQSQMSPTHVPMPTAVGPGGASGATARPPVPPPPPAPLPPPAPRPAAAAMPRPAPAPARSSGPGVGLIIGLLGMGFVFLLAAAGAGYYFFLRPGPTPTTMAQFEPPATTPGSLPDSTPASLPPVTAPDEPPATTPATAPPATAPPATAPPATAPPATQPRTPTTTAPAATTPDYAYLDEEPPPMDGRDAGERVAGAYRRGSGSSGYGASGRFEQRERSPRAAAMGERPAIAALRHVMNAQEEYQRKHGRYASFSELVSSRILALDVPVQQKEFLRKNYRFELSVESDGFTVVARPMTPGLRPFVGDDSGYIRTGTE